MTSTTGQDTIVLNYGGTIQTFICWQSSGGSYFSHRPQVFPSPQTHIIEPSANIARASIDGAQLRIQEQATKNRLWLSPERLQTLFHDTTASTNTKKTGPSLKSWLHLYCSMIELNLKNRLLGACCN